MPRQLTRRNAIKTAAAGAAATFAAPAILSARNINEQVRVAGIGVGGKGWADINGAAKHATVVAFCDVETGGNRKGGYGKSAEAWPKAQGYSDFRKLIDKEHKNLDAVTVSTPDHMHAPITMTALQHGLACYTQKPLTRTVHESRALASAAKKAGVSTQMGNQHHSGRGYRTLVKWVQDGLIGKVTSAHAWSNRPIWPQGIDRPAGSDDVPQGLDWDLWLGVAQERPFAAGVYHPFRWRGWYDFGAGALGDMGCHIIDPVVWSLGLGPAKTVAYQGPTPNAETFPKWEVLKYTFAGTQYTAGDEITMHWHDGGRKPSHEDSPHLTADDQLPSNGVLIVGEKASLLCAHGKTPVPYPQADFANKRLASVAGLDHYGVWVDGIKTGKQPNSNFAYAGPLCETVLLGVIASRVGPGEYHWDSDALKFTNSDAATAYVREPYRDGWQVEGL